jgi:acetylornithine deacetylase
MLPAHRILELHRDLVAVPSVSGAEGPIADYLAEFLGRHGVAVSRLGNTLLATLGAGPALLLDTHLDTVPPAPGWSRDPWRAEVAEGRVYGLGANDAKASVAAMTAAFLAFREVDLPVTLALALVEGEETSGAGTRAALAELARRGLSPAAAVVGEPTGLDVAIAQKGLMVLELVARGQACHAAHAAALGAVNAARRLARDLVALEGIDFGAPHPALGPVTLEPTQLRAGTARNVVPGEATAILDVRTTPALARREVVARIAAAVKSEVRVVSDRLLPRETPAGAAIVAAALAARPGARLFGSATLSDMALLDGVPAIKCGPGESARSHTPDEYATEEEVLAGARFYARLAGAWAERVVGETERAGEPDEIGDAGGARGGAIDELWEPQPAVVERAR